LSKGNLLFERQFEEPLYTFNFVRDTKLVFLIGNGEIYLWNLLTNELTHKYVSGICGMEKTITSNGKYLLSSEYHWKDNSRTRIIYSLDNILSESVSDLQVIATVCDPVFMDDDRYAVLSKSEVKIYNYDNHLLQTINLCFEKQVRVDGFVKPRNEKRSVTCFNKIILCDSILILANDSNMIIYHLDNASYNVLDYEWEGGVCDINFLPLQKKLMICIIKSIVKKKVEIELLDDSDRNLEYLQDKFPFYLDYDHGLITCSNGISFDYDE